MAKENPAFGGVSSFGTEASGNCRLVTAVTVWVVAMRIPTVRMLVAVIAVGPAITVRLGRC